MVDLEQRDRFLLYFLTAMKRKGQEIDTIHHKDTINCQSHTVSISSVGPQPA
jgi:hypothetical protein